MLLSPFAVALFVAVHVLVGQLRFLEGVPRSRWLSFAGGVAVAYVFLHLLPELSVRQRDIEGAAALALERDLYLVAMAGLATFYGLERHIRRTRAGAAASQRPATA